MTNPDSYIEHENFEEYYKNANLISLIYKQSKLDIDKIYESATFISYKTPNSQESIEKMAFYKFNNLLVYIEKIIESENGGKSGENPMDSSQQQFSSMMSKSKSYMPKSNSYNFKRPKI